MKVKSKFSQKYKDRISAIKQKWKENRQENIKLYETSVDLYENKFLKQETAVKNQAKKK